MTMYERKKKTLIPVINAVAWDSHSFSRCWYLCARAGAEVLDEEKDIEEV